MHDEFKKIIDHLRTEHEIKCLPTLLPFVDLNRSLLIHRKMAYGIRNDHFLKCGLWQILFATPQFHTLFRFIIMLPLCYLLHQVYRRQFKRNGIYSQNKTPAAGMRTWPSFFIIPVKILKVCEMTASMSRWRYFHTWHDFRSECGVTSNKNLQKI